MRRLLWIFSFLLFLSSCVFLTFCSEEKPETKEALNEKSAFLNHSKDANYVGTSKCISCHSEIHEDYSHTGKGRAFHEVSRDKILEDFTNVHVLDSFTGYHYTVFWKGEEMIVKEFRLQGKDTSYSREIKVDYVIGSGNQTRSYLFEENGYFYEIPITWYVKKGIWDLSPGYENGANTRFSRPISETCMNCHNSDFEFVENSVNKFIAVGDGIGCEKCHGPGSLHIDKWTSTNPQKQDIDYSIVNPAHLNLELQFDVCRQCHLEGVTVPKPGKDFMDYRPGMALSDFWEVFIPVSSDANDFGFASHVERLQMSKCFISSDGTMNCTTCHDAHKPLADNAISFYNEKCQTCHGIDACGAEHQSISLAENNCIQCHMPKDGTTDIPHVSTSDHFIRIHKEAEKTPAKKGGLKDFKNFTSDKNSNRDIFLANLEYYEKIDQQPGYLTRIEKFIDNVERDQKIKYYYLKKETPPNKLLGIDAKNEVNPYTSFYIGEIMQNQSLNGIPWLEKAVKLAPDNTEFATRLGNAYLKRQQINDAKITFMTVLNKNATEIMALVNLGFIYQLENDFPKALELTQKALSLDPGYARARENEINIYLNLEDLDMARQKLNDLIADYPENTSYKTLRNRLNEGDLIQ